MILSQFSHPAKLIILLFTVSLSQNLQAQISGLVVDNVSNQPIPFCSIGILGTQLGTVSNEAGEFTLPSRHLSAGDSIIFTHLNYHAFKTAIAAKDLSTELQIGLKPKVITLDEVIILAIPVTELLEKVLKTSHDRLTVPTVLKTYYREFVKRDTSYISFSDGQLDYFITPDKKELNSVLQVNGSRTFELPVAEDDQIDFDLTSALDVKAAAKYFDPGTVGKFLQKENYSDYQYELHSMVHADGKSLQYISIKPKDAVEKLLFEGKIIFDPESYLIQSIIASTPQSHQKYAKEVNAILLKLQVLSGTIIALYNQSGDIYRLSYIKREIEIRIWNKRKIDRTFTFLSDLMAFGMDTKTSPDTYPRRNNYSKNALSKRGTSYSTEYWKEGESLPLTEKEEKIISSLDSN